MRIGGEVYDRDDERFDAEAYRLIGDRDAVAWRILGWQTEPDDDTEWSGIENRTGRIVARMIGDDCDFLYEPEDFEPIDDLAYCHICGQIGCAHDGIDRTEG